jgi:hypothetical protein
MIDLGWPDIGNNDYDDDDCNDDGDDDDVSPLILVYTPNNNTTDIWRKMDTTKYDVVLSCRLF